MLKTQTLFLKPNGDVLKRIDDFLYQPLHEAGNLYMNNIVVEDQVWHMDHIYDEFDFDGYLVRRINVKKL